MNTGEADVRAPRAYDAVLAIAGLAALSAAALLSPSRVAAGPILCPFRLLTGVPCPSCGMTRSWVSLAHGHLDASLNQHPFGPAAMALVAVGTVAVMAHLLTGRWLVRPVVLKSALFVLAVAIGAFGILRWTMLAATS